MADEYKKTAIALGSICQNEKKPLNVLDLMERTRVIDTIEAAAPVNGASSEFNIMTDSVINSVELRP